MSTHTSKVNAFRVGWIVFLAIAAITCWLLWLDDPQKVIAPLIVLALAPTVVWIFVDGLVLKTNNEDFGPLIFAVICFFGAVYVVMGAG